MITEMGESAPDAIREPGARNRIGMAHMRRVRVEVPYDRYVEMFQYEGDTDIATCMRAFIGSGNEGMIEPFPRTLLHSSVCRGARRACVCGREERKRVCSGYWRPTGSRLW